MNNRTTGSCYEEIAEAFLVQKGYSPMLRNYRAYRGEIDLIMMAPPEEESAIVFVEVKYRTLETFGLGVEHVHKKKQKTIVKAAEAFLLSQNAIYAICRFDVISIDGNGNITHFANAFTK